jgi:hypothetical protein
MNIRGYIPVFKDSRISMDFDIFRYVSIFLTYFGHKEKPCLILTSLPAEEAYSGIWDGGSRNLDTG